ncbi:hypothetical protein Dda_8067 [Drechslerella dactyloides]|uniref:Uncharacterized protein n=1 Tax=Drechslerella dactyloides TaxID=74499 RepID=A0AAD6IRS3_DREDA|nr:hypothetical protein Dda_8067 [Drechslerella dactyloides]
MVTWAILFAWLSPAASCNRLTLSISCIDIRHSSRLAAMSIPPPPPPQSPSGQRDPSLFGRFKWFAAAWCRTPAGGGTTALATLYLYPFSRMLRAETPRVLPRHTSLPFFSAVFALSSYMSFAGYGRDGAGVLSAWSMVYLLVNARNGAKGWVAMSRPGGGPRAATLAVMGWNAVAGSGVFLFGWGGQGGGGGWKMKMPEAEAV